jgi:putative membrane protein
MALKISRPIIEPIEPHVFIASATMEFMTELQLTRLALVRASSDSLRSLSMQIIGDCSRMLLDIETIAIRRKLALPQALDEEHKTLLERIRAATGADFDSAYIEITTLQKRQAIRLFRRGQTIKIPDISALASRALAMLEAHVKFCRQLSGSIDSLLDERFARPESMMPPHRSGAES